MMLYPRLTIGVARPLAESLSQVSIGEAVATSGISHPAMIFAPTGGHRVSEGVLSDLQGEVREEARRFGYPDPSGDRSRAEIDAVLAVKLSREMNLSPNEASRQDVWHFVACVLLPDIVRWRFPGGSGGTTIERFLGGTRGVRNAFGRLWWRGFTLQSQEPQMDLIMLRDAGEDELVQIMERPSLAGSRELARGLLLSTLLLTKEDLGSVSRADVLRQLCKFARRRIALQEFAALPTSAQQDLLKAWQHDALVAARQAAT